MKLPFSRKQESSDLPQEVQEYYQAEKRERVGVAGLLAIGTLLITVVLAIALYFGGRWAYRAIFDDSDNTNETSQNDGAGQSTDAPSSEPNNQPAPNNLPAGEQPDDSADTDGDDDSSDTVASSRNSSNGNIPDTGPGDSLALFVGTTVIAGTVYYIRKRPALG